MRHEVSRPAWQFECSVESDARPQFAWTYWTNIENWADPPAQFQLEGPFAPGSRLITRLPGHEPLQSVIREVGADRAAVIEMALPGAALCFHWRFDELPGNRTRITQRLTLNGANAGALVEEVARGFEPNVPEGMKRLAARIACAEASTVPKGARILNRTG